VFFTVKLYDTDSALGLLEPLIGPETVVVPLQNGIESVERIAGAVGRGHVAGGVAYLAAVIAEPGVIRHTANQRLSFGELDGARSGRLERLLEACTKAGLEARLSERIQIDIWTKFVWLSMFSGVTAVARLPAGTIREDPDLLVLCQAAAMEGMAVAHAKGISLPHATFADIGPSLHALPPQAKSSLLEDLERGRPLELPWLSGAIVKLGEEVGVPTPTHRFIKTVLGPYAKGFPAV
jgi:2-dehydropantoate 2-reductase